MVENKFPKLDNWIYASAFDLVSKECFKRVDPNTGLTTARVYNLSSGNGNYIGYIYRGRHQDGATNWWMEHKDQDVVKFLVDVKLCDIGYKINNLI